MKNILQLENKFFNWYKPSRYKINEQCIECSDLASKYSIESY